MSGATQLPTKPQFREATNLLRGICAFAILVWHYQHFFYVFTDAIDLDLETQPFFKFLEIPYRFGFQAVPIFWCVSGLILTHTYVSNPDVSARSFFVSRVARLYPLHLLTLITVAILQVISISSYQEFQIYGANDFYHFVLHLFLIQSWGFAGGNSFNAQTWSVSVEIAVYIIFFLILKKLQKFETLGALVVLFICLSINGAFGRVANKLFFFESLTYFAAGIVIYFMIEKFHTHYSGSLKLVINSIILGSLLTARFSDYLLFNSESNSWFWILASLVFFVAQIDGTTLAHQFKKFKIFGNLSYSVFLWHIPIQIMIKLIQAKYSIDNSIAYNKLFFIFFITLTYSVGYLSYRFIEQPAQRYLRQRLIRS